MALAAVLTTFTSSARADDGFSQLRAWGSDGAAPGQLHFPSAIAVRADGAVLVLDSSNQRVEEFTPEGDLARIWGAAGSDDGQFLYPKGLALAPDGTVVITDTANNRVERFNADGTFNTAFGVGQLSQPSGLAIDGQGIAFIADRTDNRIVEFSPSGKLLKTWIGDGPTPLSKPHHVVVSGDAVYVADAHALRRFDRDGHLQWERTTTSYDGGLLADAAGDVYAGRSGISARVDEFAPSGALIGSFGSYGQGDDQVQNPYGLAFDCQSNIYVVDAYASRVQKFGQRPETFPPCDPVQPAAPPPPADIPPPPPADTPPSPPTKTHLQLVVRLRSPQHLGHRRTLVALGSCDRDCRVSGFGTARVGRLTIRLRARGVSVPRGTFVALRYPVPRALAARLTRARGAHVGLTIHAAADTQNVQQTGSLVLRR